MIGRLFHFFTQGSAESLRSYARGVKSIEIPFAKMRPLTELTGPLELLFATKEGLPIPRFPISHSALAFRSGDTFSVYGRQSPLDVSNWLVRGISFRTQVDNEQSYLSQRFNFKGYPTNVFLTPVEVSQLLKEADRIINQNQFCNLISSNCYSFSVTGLVRAVNKIVERPTWSPEEIEKILTVLEDHPLGDHCAVGVFNNAVVVGELLALFSKIKDKILELEIKTLNDHRLLKRVNILTAKVESGSGLFSSSEDYKP
ncbi:Uncharacterised protein (plasmid) [Legionella adelaidensis]|uniref:Uncharacterized protein n=1 Tax=Legionella adelaidensis TaxID=45056 RepID=A0A0W0R1W9_9GAMM|nr:hypothetical protein [Legionella adelaidensis]KTC65045.1 hypothetical protein Lade_1568 [Legionella adelaidensis]VEH85436.1 Uncharacterised protein [Legionella adelaidensis]